MLIIFSSEKHQNVKNNCHNITEILVKVALKHHQTNKQHLTINAPNECSPRGWNVLGSTTITLNQTLKLICAASLLITQHYRVRKVPDWLEIRSNK